MDFRLFTSVLLVVFGCTTALAQGPNNSNTYYKDADGKTGSDLKTALGIIISDADRYNQQTYKQLWTAYATTDIKPDGVHVYDIYSNISNFVYGEDQAGNYKKEGDVYNREHTFPKSWFNDGYPMYTDLFHVMPSDGYVNSMRGNYPYGETDANGSDKINYKSANGYSKRGYCKTPGYTGVVFEPNDEYKGDLARNFFYMATCYEDRITSWDSEVLTNSSYKPYVEWHMDMLMRWAEEDPVSEKEILRNAAVYDIQNNRNPFIDYPGLEKYIWGSKVGVPFSYDNYDATDAIMQINDDANGPQDNEIYDLQGRRVKYPTRGIYIRNGRKILIK